eukprot:CAMPEP_0184666896 /NCGR_PEP_ID=MMETSP0308-20130426/64463_1 /TAXON_ID=38269 /ORGANISM="Gloeochaete witrockiana, Strain SAG 46.84" /LENGTH=157 /DNA_ID=CAMNT_0027111779 /DNA_START=33 /DNA_END=507 /DNA_ORIENTATION=+
MSLLCGLSYADKPYLGPRSSFGGTSRRSTITEGVPLDVPAPGTYAPLSMYDRLYFAQISQSMGTSLHEVRRSPLSYLKNGEVPPGVVSGQIPKKELKHFISVMTAYNSPPASLSGGTSPLNKRLPSIDDFYDTDLLEHFPGSSLSPTNHQMQKGGKF